MAFSSTTIAPTKLSPSSANSATMRVGSTILKAAWAGASFDRSSGSGSSPWASKVSTPSSLTLVPKPSGCHETPVPVSTNCETTTGGRPMPPSAVTV